MKRISPGVIATILLPCLLCHAGPSSKTVRGVRTESPPLIDGNLDEPQWKAATPVLDFTQYDPDEGALPSEVTSVRILYDNRALYVGVICYDAHPDQVVPQLSRRDRSTEADRFSVIIDSYHDHQTAFLFSTNVSGVQSDGVLSQDGLVYDVTWDAVWRVATRRHRDGWSAEFEIPFNALRFASRDGREYEWGINFRRYISRKREVDEWVMVPRKDVPPASISPVSPIGSLVGLRGIDPPVQLSIIPYVSGKGTVESSEPGRRNGTTYSATGGMDLKYGLTRDFTVDATVNPDFGQVEVDQAVLNLTVFETEYPEKRPFFMEGAPLFVFGSSVDNGSLPLFFSRRIGRRPSGSALVSAPSGGYIKEDPQVTPILGAAKLTGRSSSGFSLGMISTATGEEQAVVVDAAGRRTSIRTEPRGTYDVLRLKQDFTGGSWLGGIATIASREFMLPSASAGVDWNARLAEGEFAVDGYAAGARSSVSAGARDGAAGRLLLARIAAEHWLFAGSFDFATRFFNPNDLGFFAQPHDEGSYVQVIYRENFANGFIRRYSLSVVPESRWNWDGVRTKGQIESVFSMEFEGFWSATVTHDYRPPSYDDAERGIVGIYRRPDDHAFSFLLTSDSRQRVGGSLNAGYEFDAARKGSFSLSLNLTVRPTSWLELAPIFYYQRTWREQAWLFPDGNIVDTTIGVNPFSVFGRRALDELNLALRGTVAFTRTLSLQFFSQVLIARGRYGSFTRLDGNGKLIPYDYSAYSGYTNHDFNQATLNANGLLRWECLPGSVLYLVWSQGRFGDSGLYATTLGRRLVDVFSLPREDVFLLKFSYWLPL